MNSKTDESIERQLTDRIIVVDKKADPPLLPKISLWNVATGEDKRKRDKRREELRERFGLNKTKSTENFRGLTTTDNSSISPIKQFNES